VRPGGLTLPELYDQIRAEGTVDSVNGTQLGINSTEFEPGNRSLIRAHSPRKLGLTDPGILTRSPDALTKLESAFSAIVGVLHLRGVWSLGLDVAPSSVTSHCSVLLSRVSLSDTPIHFSLCSFNLCTFV
jgi:hypothetical protein